MAVIIENEKQRELFLKKQRIVENKTSVGNDMNEINY